MQPRTSSSPTGAHAADLVVTLGPASVGVIRELAEAGSTAFRLNASHLDCAALVDWLTRARAAAPATPLVVDLQGAKMRLGELTPRPVTRGDTVRFMLHPDGDAVPLPHPELFAAVRPGEVLSCDDDRLRCELVRVDQELLVARWLTDGTLAPRKGINRAAHPVEPAGLSERDRAQLAAVSGFSGVSIAYSFMTDGHEAAWVRSAAPGCPVIAKVERAEAVAAIDKVIASVDSAWICRGDLGAQLGLRELARFVVAWRPPTSGPPVLMAGQVLHHLTSHPDVTRSEACHLFELLERGYAGIVLSDETAIGVAPLNAVKTARRLLDELR